MSTAGARRRSSGWRRWVKIIHRDVGYLCVALTCIYAISGIAVNHISDWNPSYRIERVQRDFDPFPVSDGDTMVALAVERLALPGPPAESFRPDPTTVQLFYDGWSVEVNAVEGTALIERPRGRFLLRDFNDLHLNRPKGAWTWAADAYAALLFVLAITGIFMLKGRQGLAGRGKWFILAGLLLPVAFIVLFRFF